MHNSPARGRPRDTRRDETDLPLRVSDAPLTTEWPDVPKITHITFCPTLAPDGSVLRWEH
jgi:hypothetical protein